MQSPSVSVKIAPIEHTKLTSMLNDEIPVWYQAILKDVIGRFKTLEQKYLKPKKGTRYP